MTETLVLERAFDASAQQAITMARRLAAGSGKAVIDTPCLLKGLAEVGWPSAAALIDMRRCVRAAQLRSGTTEQEGEVEFAGMMFSRETETTLGEAVELAVPAEARAEHLLMALAGSAGSDATGMLRAITEEQDPWVKVRWELRRELRSMIREPVGADRAQRISRRQATSYDRMVALVYLLLRDELSFGKVIRHVQELEKMPNFDGIEFTNAHGEAMAREVVDRLWG